MTVAIDGRSLSPADVERVAREGAAVTITDGAHERLERSRARVETVLEGEEPVYGVNTGFGELVDERIPGEDLEALQANLLRSHAAGGGGTLSREAVRAMMLTRANALACGHSGVRPVVVETLATMLNEGVHPVVPSRGSLGASGDLAPLAHLSLVLIGEGFATVEPPGTGGFETAPAMGTDGAPTDDSGTRAHRDGETALATAGLEPLALEAKEGLALINGTQLTLGLAALVVRDAERLVRAADAAGSLTIEVTMGTPASAAAAIQSVRPHPGQADSAAAVRAMTANSAIVDAHRNCDRVQDAYSLRCIPQVHGAVRDAVSHLRSAVETELNSATDNPLLFPAAEAPERASGRGDAAVLSGGNFHGEPLALRLEYLGMALTELAAMAERRIDRLLNPNLQEPHLPPFLAGEPGIESGFMLVQYAAAAHLNEMRSLGGAAIDNVPVSGGQEDHVSMSAQSALDARRRLGLARRVLAGELLVGAEAAEYVGAALAREDRAGTGEPASERTSALVERAPDVDPGAALGDGSAWLYDRVREVVDPLATDRPVHPDVDALEAMLCQRQFHRELAQRCRAGGTRE